MRTLRSLAAIFLGLALPAAAFAQTTSSSAQASSLIAEITALEQQIASLSGGTQTTAATAAPTSPPSSATFTPLSSSNSCPDLTETLSLGSSGAQVVSLQTFLAQQGVFAASATGYFGAVTQASVSEWQEKNGVVAGGDANSTGLGVVGPKTRAAISAMCGAGGTAAAAPVQCLDVQPPTADCGTGWQPVLDAAGCAMYYECVVQLPGSGGSTVGTSVAATSSTSNACPVIVKPTCAGSLEPYQTNANGCVLSYICAL